VRALLRRAGPEVARAEAAGRFAFDAEARTVRVDGGEPVRLTKLEHRLLQYLLARTGRAVSSERIWTHVWGAWGTGDRQLLKQLVHRLRQKIETDPAHPCFLLTESGVGYRLDPEGGAGRPASPERSGANEGA
jgi:DNA-binding response OmpR family regulator